MANVNSTLIWVPQVRIETDRNSMWSNGFTSAEECRVFAQSICFDITIWEYDNEYTRRLVFLSESF